MNAHEPWPLTSMEEEAKAAQEIAKTTGKAIDAAQSVGGFLAKYINGPLEQGIGIFEDKLKYMRWERQVRLMQRADELLKSRGLDVPTRPVPMKIAIPIMQGGTLEEDDSLQDLWAMLLANAGNANSGIDVRRTFLSILEDLSSEDAVALKKIYAVPLEDAPRGIWTQDLPERVLLKDPERDNLSPQVQMIIRNLVRLGLVDTPIIYAHLPFLAQVYITVLGKEFMKACTS